jgi:hypothetical protein
METESMVLGETQYEKCNGSNLSGKINKLEKRQP